MKELETKFLLARGRRPQKALRRLLQDLAWAGFQIQPKTTRLVQDVYFDTKDERLRRAGWSLRCRHKSLALVLTCKQLGQSDDGFFERREIEQTTLHETPHLDSLEEGPVLSLLRRYLPESAELKALFTQDNERSTYHLSHPDHPRATIEMVFDRVRVDGRETLRYVEFEGELKQGPIAILEAFSAVLAAHPDLSQSRTSKFHRGFFNSRGSLDVGGRARDLMTPEDAWSKLGAHYLAEQMHALKSYEPYAHEGLHVEGVHQMRVATRRLRAALKAFGDVLPEDPARSLAAEAGWLCDVLGAVRDLDVHLEHLHGYRRELPKGRRHSLDAYEQHLEGARLRARRCLTTALDSNRFRRFLASYLALQERAQAIDETTSPTIAEFAHGYVPKRLTAVRRDGRKIQPDSAPEAYHRLRIRIKKLRYGLEILNGPYGAELARASKSLRRLQNRLGEHQDACVAEDELANYRDKHAESAREKRTFDRLISSERDRAQKLRRRFRADWARFESESRKLKKLF
jgi:CHAD domain-containing protein